MRAIPVITISACAGLALAGHVTTPSGQASATAEAPAFITITVDVSGIEFRDPQGDAINEILSLNLTPNIFVTGIGWEVNLTTIGASWASEANIGFNDEVFLAPAIGDDFPVSSMHYSSGGIIDLLDVGLDWIFLEPDGVLNLEFFDTFDDNPDAADAFFESGSELFLRVGYPTTGTAVALSLGVLCTTRRRR